MKRLLLIILLAFLWILPCCVKAAPEPLGPVIYETTIYNWHEGNLLSLNISDLPTGAERYLYLIQEGGSSFSVTGTTLPSTSFLEGSTVILKEFLHLDYYTSSSLGIEEIDYHPVQFNTSQSPYSVTSASMLDYTFQNYNYSSPTIYYRKLNVIDNNGNIITVGGDKRAYFSVNNEKAFSYSLGSIIIPNLNTEFDLHVRGNVAVPDGHFFIETENANYESYGYTLNGDNTHVISNYQWDDSMNTCYGFGDDETECDSNYVITVEDGVVEETDTTGTYNLVFDVEARYTDEGVETGLLYNILPYIILISLLIICIIIYQKRRKTSS